MSSVAGGSNTFVPSFEGSERAKFEFSRNPKSFSLPNYAAMRKVNRSVGYYLKGDVNTASRIVDSNLHAWADGSDGTPSPEGQVEFDFLEYRTERSKYDFFIGQKAVEQAAFDVVPMNSRAAAQRAMTDRSLKTVTALGAASWGSNTATATAAGGGKWSASSASNQYIQASFQYAIRTIHTVTQGAVPPGSVKFVCGPALAHNLRKSEEILDFIKQQTGAQAMLSDRDREFQNLWGIPRYLYGAEVVVEDCVRNTIAKGGTASKGYLLDTDTAYFVTNTVDLSANTELPPGEGVQLFDTVTLFVYEDMTVESKNDADNRRVWGRVVDDTDQVVTCVESGFRVTSIWT